MSEINEIIAERRAQRNAEKAKRYGRVFEKWIVGGIEVTRLELVNLFNKQLYITPEGDILNEREYINRLWQYKPVIERF